MPGREWGPETEVLWSQALEALEEQWRRRSRCCPPPLLQVHSQVQVVGTRRALVALLLPVEGGVPGQLPSRTLPWPGLPLAVGAPAFPSMNPAAHHHSCCLCCCRRRRRRRRGRLHTNSAELRWGGGSCPALTSAISPAALFARPSSLVPRGGSGRDLAQSVSGSNVLELAICGGRA